MDLSSPVYPYQQIAKQLRDKIADGTITGQLPTIEEIQDSTTPRAAYNTVRRAIGILVEEGLVETAPGRGTFVRRQG